MPKDSPKVRAVTGNSNIKLRDSRMTTTYLELINRGAKTYPDRTAIVYQDQSFTFRQVDELSSQLANAMNAAGIKQGDCIALLLNNGPYSVPVDFACVKTGINRVPLNSRLSISEHAKMLRDTGAKRILFGADLAAHAAALKAELPELECLGVESRLDGGIDLAEQARPQSCEAPQITVQGDDVVATLFTSGTTGTLKAAQHTQASYAAICKNVLMNVISVEHNDAMLHAASLIHASGVFVLPLTWFPPCSKCCWAILNSKIPMSRPCAT